MTFPSTVVPLAPVHAHIVGIVRGKEVDSDAVLELDGPTITIVWGRAAPWRLSLEGIDGVMVDHRHLTLYLRSGDVLDLRSMNAHDGEKTDDVEGATSDALRQWGTQLVERATTMPELTRGLRALGSRRGPLGTKHDAWFAPLLNARRAVAGVSDALRQAALLNADHIAGAMRTVMTELAVIQAPADPAVQRAIEAVLEEEAEPLFSALARMAVAADALQGGALDTRLLDWRRWVDTLRAVYEAADAAWVRSADVLDA